MRPCALLSPRRARSTPACARVRVRSASSVGSSSQMRLRRPARTVYARRSSRLRSWRLLVHPLFAIFPLLIAKNELLDLARRGLGELGELDGLGGLETSDMLFAEIYDLLFGRLLPLLEHDECLRALAPLLVRDGDDRGLHDGRVARHGLLHLDGRDVLPTGDDDVLVSVPDLHVPVRMPHCDIAGVVPTTLERLLGRLLVLEVTLGDHVPVHHDLAHRLPVALHVV